MKQRFALFVFAYLLLVIPAAGALEEVSAVLAAGETSGSDPHGQMDTVVPIRAFDLLTPQEGWVLRGQELIWSDNGGHGWHTITPSTSAGQTIAAVTFLDQSQGRVILVEAGEPVTYALGSTTDSGRHWQVEPLTLFDAGAPIVYPQAIEQSWLDAQTGWLVVRQASSSNFSRGFLFRTDDGGHTWTQLTTPAAQPVLFLDRDNGWTLGHPATGTLFRTRDGGHTWTVQPYRVGLNGDTRPLRAYLPHFTADGTTGLLPILVDRSGGQQVAWLASIDGGEQWVPYAQMEADESAAGPAADPRRADPHTWLLARSGGRALADGGEALPVPGRSGTRVHMASADVGWGLVGNHGSLLRTTDGGRSWTPLSLPAASGELALRLSAAPVTGVVDAGDTVGRTSVFMGAGFDTCDLPGMIPLQVWRNASPYGVINLYLGGVLRFCGNEELSAERLQVLAGEGWKFIPTWVGPQAPCSGYRSRFSADPNTAFAQGAAEAAAALAAASTLGLTLPQHQAGTIIYYDLESFDTGDESCTEAAKAFVAGWSDHLHAAGSQSGLYGSACLPRMDIYAGIANPPDAIWIASWIGSVYDPSMTVWDVPCLSNTLWNQAQRIRQYAGGHDETWGEITLNIDSNVLLGLVADLAKPAVVPAPVTLEQATLRPHYDGDLCSSAWHRFINVRGHAAYLTLNRQKGGTIPPVTNEATWEADLPAAGYYRVEAFVPAHELVKWTCPEIVVERDTSSALYRIEHGEGEAHRLVDQSSMEDAWVDLGTYAFSAEQPARVQLSDETEEAPFTRTVSASALRFTPATTVISPTGTLFLPVVEH